MLLNSSLELGDIRSASNMRDIKPGEMKFFRKRKRKLALSLIAKILTNEGSNNIKLWPENQSTRVVNQQQQQLLQEHFSKSRRKRNDNNNNYLPSKVLPSNSRVCLSLTALIIIVTFMANSMIFSSQNVVHQVNAAKVSSQHSFKVQSIETTTTTTTTTARTTKSDNDIGCFAKNKTSSCAQMFALQVVDKVEREEEEQAETGRGSEKAKTISRMVGWPTNNSTTPVREEGNEKALYRSRRSTTTKTTAPATANRDKGASTRIVAVAGQWIELQCPLASELFALTNSNTNSHHSDRSIVWRKNGAKLNPLNPRYKINALNGSLIITSAQPHLDEASYECKLIRISPKSSADEQEQQQKPENIQLEEEQQEKQRQQEEEIASDDVSKRHNFELKLIKAPKVAPFEFPTDAEVGMKVQLICSILEGQQPVSFVWLKDNQIIEQSGSSSSSNNNNNQLTSSEAIALRSANSLNQLHRQQLADKYSPGIHSTASQKSEYVIIVDNQSIMQQDGDQQQTKRLITDESMKEQQPQQQILSTLSDSNIRVRQLEDSSILSIERLELKHSGRYTCSVQNEAGRASHSSQLVINAPPSFTIEPKDGNLVSGESSMIDCAASGQPRPTISWLRARESSASKLWDYLPVYDNMRFSTLANGSLVINNVTQREQGYYVCSAKNGFGPEMTKEIRISVHEPAKFNNKYKTVEVRIEDRANMICMASGELPINIEWFDKDGNAISKNDKKFIIDNENSDDKGNNNDSKIVAGTTTTTTTTSNKTISRLILARSGRADSGHYICVANNKYGSDKMVTNLLVQDVPDKVTELKVTNTTSTTISLRWQLSFSGNSPITSYLVQYQSDDPLDDLLMSSSPIKAAGTSLLDGSIPTTAANGEVSSSSSSSLLSSSSSTSSSSKTSQQQQQLQSSSSSLALKTALDALNIASNLENADEAIDRTLVELTVEQSSTYLVVKDLSPYCVYRLRLAGINKIGLGEFSDWIRAKTEEASPGGVALKIIAAATGPNSIKITWNPPDRRLWNGPLIGFNIGYRPIDSSFELNKSIEWTPPTLQSIMLDADKHQQQTKIKQQFQMVQKTMMEQNINQQQQLPGRMSAPNSTSTSTSTSSSSTTTTIKPEIENSKYILRQHLRQLLALQQQELVAHLTNLQRSTTYLVWIQAINNKGFGPKSHAITVKTLDDVPPSAPAIKIQSTTPSSITIAWSMLSNFVSPANQYSLFYRRVPHIINQSQQQNHKSFNNLSDQSILGGVLPSIVDNFVGTSTQPLPHSIEFGPFIERTITSKQLMFTNNNGVNMYSGNSIIDAAHESILNEVKPSFIHQHQQQQNQQQHYQQFVYTLDQLECGSVYELYMTTRNSVGKSEPSSIVTTKTLGEPPLAPVNKNSLFSKIGINDVMLNLASWSTGGCPLTHITVRYKQSPVPVASAALNPLQQQQQQSSASNLSSSISLSWPITINLPASILENINNAQNTPISNKAYLSSNSQDHDMSISQQQPVYLLKNLLPSTYYELEISAYNTAGQTTAQYEFVTSNLNGTRSGFSRKDGVFRIDQRFNTQIDTQQQQQPFDSSRILEQHAFKNNSGSGGQLIPLVLMILCFVCLIISSTFCYYRLKDNWKNQTSRSLSDSGSSAGGGPGSSRGGLHCQQINSSPSSIGGKSSSMWRLTTGRSTMRHQHHHHHQQQQQPSIEQSDSPTTMHYCMQDQAAGNQMLNSSLNQIKNPSSFSQSVSMKDFNSLVPPVSQNMNYNNQSNHLGAASTLNFKNYRSSIRPLSDAKHASSTLRARLQSIDTYDQIRGGGAVVVPTSAPQGYNSNTLNHNQICSAYAAIACKQQKQLEQATYLNNQNNQPQTVNTDYATNGSITPYEPHQYMYSVNENQPQQAETSWTNFDSTQTCLPHNNKLGNPTNYAIPQQTYSDPASAYNNTNQLNYQQENNYGENSIDACIQQLMSQQYQQPPSQPPPQQQHQFDHQQQQQQQQQQYAMIVNLKVDQQNNRCTYGNGESVDYEVQNGNKSQQGHNQAKVKTVSGQSVVDSSGSSSSGIDVGTHLDCGSSVAGTNNSNNSNAGGVNYQFPQPSSEGEKFNQQNSLGCDIDQSQQQFQQP